MKTCDTLVDATPRAKCGKPAIAELPSKRGVFEFYPPADAIYFCDEHVVKWNYLWMGSK